MIEKKRVITIEKTPDEVRAIFEKAIKGEDPTIVFPAEYQPEIGHRLEQEPDGCVVYSDWPSLSITIEILEKKPGPKKGSKRGKNAPDTNIAGEPTGLE